MRAIVQRDTDSDPGGHLVIVAVVAEDVVAPEHVTVGAGHFVNHGICACFL